ncbi:MAG: hypothetical protein FJW23_07135 [Acidimicrobiia bacterium]|nr:hypothetical protein [Acidimicrobiia bacterium]
MTPAAEATPAAAREAARTHAGASPRRTHQLYLGLTLLLIAMVAAGFWPGYFGPLLSTGVTRPWIVHVHGAVFTGWMALLLLQVVLASTGRIRLHQRVGNLGIAYGVLVLVLGIVVSFAAPVLHVQAGTWTLERAAGFLILPLGDMVLFAGFFGAAIACRRKPEIHRRLMLAATVALAFAGAARMSLEPPLVFLLVWLSPLLVAIAFEAVTMRRVHKVNVVSVAVLAVAFLRTFYRESDAWMAIGRALLEPFL